MTKVNAAYHLMSNLDSEEHVSIDRYGSEEIIDIIDHKKQTQGSAAPKGIFSYIALK